MRVTRLIVLVMALVTTAGFLMLYHYLTIDLENQTFQATEEALVDTAHLLAGVVEADISDDKIQLDSFTKSLALAQSRKFEAQIFNLNKSAIGTHVYITNLDGTVIYDSQDSQLLGKDMSQYNDVILAQQGRYAARSTRTNPDDPNSSVFYIGVPLKSADANLGTLTVYKRQQDVRAFITTRKNWISLSVSMIAIGIIIFTIAVFTWIFRPIGKLTNYARAITRGERPDLPKLGRGREVNTLGRALENMRESLDGKSYVENYTQILTHELKSPLAAIRASSELLQEEMSPEQRQKFLTNISHETARSERIIDGLLKLSHLEAQAQLSKKKLVPFSVFAQRLEDSYQSRFAPKNIQFKVTHTEDLELICDPDLLEAALANLLENSIHFSPENSVIELSAKSKGSNTVITLTDQGSGIPEYALDRIFDHFYSLSTPSSTQKSSGLGLAFVKEIIDLHQGSITLLNLPDQGTIATITL